MGKESTIVCSIVGRVESGTNSMLCRGEREKGVVSSKQEWHKTSTLAGAEIAKLDKVSGKEDLKVWTEVEEVRGGYCTSRIGCADLRRILYRSKKEDTRESFVFFFFFRSSLRGDA